MQERYQTICIRLSTVTHTINTAFKSITSTYYSIYVRWLVFISARGGEIQFYRCLVDLLYFNLPSLYHKWCSTEWQHNLKQLKLWVSQYMPYSKFQWKSTETLSQRSKAMKYISQMYFHLQIYIWVLKTRVCVCVTPCNVTDSRDSSIASTFSGT